jgi:hypothetical protein
MSEVETELRKSVLEAMRTNTELLATNAAIYDIAPRGTAHPYIDLEPEVVNDDGADCIESFEIYLNVHCWTRVGHPINVRRLCAGVRTALHEQELPIVDHALVSLQHEQTRYLIDPDETVEHSLVSFRALVDIHP